MKAWKHDNSILYGKNCKYPHTVLCENNYMAIYSSLHKELSVIYAKNCK